VVSPSRILVIAANEFMPQIRRQLRRIPRGQLLVEPAPRGTAQKPAFFPTLALPSNFDLSDSFQSTEVRLSKEFKIVAERLKLELTGELFNVFNTSNKLGFRGDLDSGFGQATSKASPTFGLGGPRVFQIGGRIKF